MKKVAIIDKAPSSANYSKYFDFDFDLYHMSDVPIKKLLKKDVTLVVDLQPYDLVILVGSEAAKEYAKITSVTTMMGILVQDKFMAMPNPSVLIFKPEGKQDFLRAVDKIKAVYNTGSQITQQGDYKGIDNTEEAIEFLREVLDHPSEDLAFDTETTALYPRDGYVLGLSLCCDPLKARYISSDCLDETCLSILNKIFLIKKVRRVAHHLKFDYKMIKFHLGLEFDRDSLEDTMVMHYVLDENAQHGLKALALKYTDFGNYDEELETYKKQYCRDRGIKEEDFNYGFIPFNVISKYAAIDSAATLVLYRKFKPIIEANEKLNSVYRQLMMPSTLFLMDMEEAGIPVDKNRLLAAKNYLDKEIEAAKVELFTNEHIIKFGEDNSVIFNPNSVNHLRAVLFDYLGLPPTGKLTDTGAISTDAEVLEELAELDPLPALLLKVRKLIKIRNTYIDKILLSTKSNGKIYTNFNNTYVTSGRLSSSGTINAQQIVRDDPIVKGCIKAPAGYKIVSQDLKTGEVYYAAVLSKDRELQKIFSLGGDLHSNIAKSVFNLTCSAEEVKKLYPELRQAAKAITFGILYGAAAAKVASEVTKATGKYYSEEEAQENIDDYFAKFSVLKRWLDARKSEIKTNGFIYSFFGRKRRLTNVFSSDRAISSHEVRSGINFLIQSVCSDVNLLAAIETQKEIEAINMDAKIFMLVHDSIVALVKEDCVDLYKDLLRKHTQRDRGVSIPGFPIGIDQEVGDDYSFGKFEEYYEIRGDSLARISA